MKFGASAFLYGLLLVPGLMLFFRRRERKRQQALGEFGEMKLVRQLIRNDSIERRKIKQLLLLVALGLSFLAMARPQLGERSQTIKRTGIDVIVALDTSKSMLAEDIKPNRLSAAKREIRALIHRLEGDRIGLIGFAGTSAVLSPLTLDYGAAEIFLEEIDTDIVSVPGTNLADAIQKAQQSFVKGEQKYRILVLITDGQNTVGDPVKAAQQAYEEGIRIFCIGLGQPGGMPIPLRDEQGRLLEYKKDQQGGLVQAELDEELLENIVTASDGVYYRATNSLDELDVIYDEVRAMEEKELKSQIYVQHIDRYQWFMLPAVFLLIVEFILPITRKTSEKRLERRV